MCCKAIKPVKVEAYVGGDAVEEKVARRVMLFGSNQVIETALSKAGFSQGAPAGLLVNAEATPDLAAIAARCHAFVEALPAAQEGLIVTILVNHRAGLADWQAGATAAGLRHFTRDAALGWAPRGVRVNMIEILRGVPEADVAATVLLMTRLPSMTGQTISLGAS
jgi:NAD(P)-dependent dehydrogenase (short-subunit alcohol dehydrogenase family)